MAKKKLFKSKLKWGILANDYEIIFLIQPPRINIQKRDRTKDILKRNYERERSRPLEIRLNEHQDYIKRKEFHKYSKIR